MIQAASDDDTRAYTADRGAMNYENKALGTVNHGAIVYWDGGGDGRAHGVSGLLWLAKS